MSGCCSNPYVADTPLHLVTPGVTKLNNGTTPLLPPTPLLLLRVDTLHASPAALTPHYKIVAAALQPHLALPHN